MVWMIPLLVLTIGLFILSVLGGFGLTLSVFKGLKTIPPFFLIAIIVIVVIYLLKGRGK